jgi:hypothetical protein
VDNDFGALGITRPTFGDLLVAERDREVASPFHHLHFDHPIFEHPIFEHPIFERSISDHRRTGSFPDFLSSR